MFICFLSLFVSIQVSDAYVKVLCIIVLFSLNFGFLGITTKFYCLLFIILLRIISCYVLVIYTINCNF